MYEDLNEAYEDMYDEYYKDHEEFYEDYDDIDAQCDNDCVGCLYNIDDECRIDESEE